MKGLINMKKALLILTLFMLVFTSCEDNFLFDFTNPIDPESEDFGGELTISDPNRLMVVSPTDEDPVIFPVLEISRCPNVYGFVFEVADSSDFEDSLILWSEITSSTTDVEVRPDFEFDSAEIYYWRAAGILEDGSWSDYSDTGSFTMRSGISGESPSDYSEHWDTSPLLEWDDIENEGTVTYEVRYAVYDEILNEADLTSATVFTVSDSEYQVELDVGLQYGDRVYWQVRAVDEYNVPGVWCSAYYFDLVWDIDWVVDPEDSGYTIDTSPLLFWESVDEAVSYNLRYAGSEDGLDSATQYSITDPVDSETNPEYQIEASEGWIMGETIYWQLQAVNTDGVKGEWSEVFDFEISLNVSWEDISPSDGGMAAETRPLLDWGDVSGAVGYSVRFSDVLTNVEYADEKDVTDSEYQISLSEAFDYGDTVYWQIQAENEDGEKTAWSSIYDFLVNWDVTWSGLSPADTALLNTTTLTLDWDDVNLADSYLLVYAESEAALSTADEHSVTDSSYEITDPIENGTTIYWQVEVFNGNNESGGSSDVYSFSVVIESGVTITDDLDDIGDAVDITFSGESEFLIIGEEMTVSAVFSEFVASVQWYLDGSALTGETSTSVTVGDGLGLGGYTLTLVVTTYDDELFSESLWFEVDDGLELGQSIGGGLVFYIDESDPDNRWALIAAESDQGTDNIWGGYYTYVGGTLSDVGSGAANTAAIVASFGDTDPWLGYDNYAAKVCNDLELNGYDDWYLPSFDDTAYMYSNLRASGLGSFSTDYYWTSTESSSYYAYYNRIYYSGYTGTTSKSNSYSIRAVRTMYY